MLTQAVVLVGGRGTRLGSLTRDTPKPLLDIGGRPFLDILVNQLARHGFSRITFLAGFAAEKISDYAGSKHVRGTAIEVIREDAPLGTAGCLINAMANLEETFLVMNGDTYFDINLLGLLDVFSDDAEAALALREVSDVSRYGSVRTDSHWRVTVFSEKSGSGRGYISSGIATLKRSALAGLPSGYTMLEQDVFPRLAAEGRLYAKPFRGEFIDIGLPETYAAAPDILSNAERRPAVFLDRDGTLNRDEGYTYRPDDLIWIGDAIAAVRLVNDAGFYAFVITNQAGVARGYYDEADVLRFHRAMQQNLRQAGAHFDDIRYCPHHPEGVHAAYSKTCACRKPNTGMLRSLFDTWSIDLERSVLVGDQEKDRVCAETLGIPFIQATAGKLSEALRPYLETRGVRR